MKNGVDITKIQRFEKLSQNQNFFDKYFTIDEKKYINSKGNNPQTIAGIYAAKEAVLKAFGIGIGNGLDLADICVLHDKFGAPYINVDAKINYYLLQSGCNEISISISHDGEYAIAFCVIS